MKVFVFCKNCGNEIKLKKRYPSRWEIVEKEGHWFQLKCSNCSQIRKYNTDETFAKKRIISTIAFLLIWPVIFVSVYFLYPYALKGGIRSIFLLLSAFIVPAVVYKFITDEEQKKVSLFNKSRVNRFSNINVKRRFE